MQLARRSGPDGSFCVGIFRLCRGRGAIASVRCTAYIGIQSAQ